MLRNDLIKYLTHKMHLAECSQYYQSGSIKYSVEWAKGFYQFLKYQANQISERELALMVRNSEKHLKNLVPHENNKSHASSMSNFNLILENCTKLLTSNKLI